MLFLDKGGLRSRSEFPVASDGHRRANGGSLCVPERGPEAGEDLQTGQKFANRTKRMQDDPQGLMARPTWDWGLSVDASGERVDDQRETDGNTGAPAWTSDAHDSGKPEPNTFFCDILALCKCPLELYKQPES